MNSLVKKIKPLPTQVEMGTKNSLENSYSATNADVVLSGVEPTDVVLSGVEPTTLQEGHNCIFKITLRAFWRSRHPPFRFSGITSVAFAVMVAVRWRPSPGMRVKWSRLVMVMSVEKWDDQYGELAEFLRHQQGEASARGCVLCRLECLLAAMRTTTDTTADSSCAQGEP